MSEKVVELECPDPDCKRRWLSSHGEYCPKCVAHGYKNKGVPVK